MPFLSAFRYFYGCTQCYNQSPLALKRFNLPIRGANTKQPHPHQLADTTLPMLAQIQHTQPLLFNKPSPSVSKAKRPSQSPFAGPGCSERRHPGGGTRTTSPLPTCRGDLCKGKLKGHGRTTKGTKAPHIPVCILCRPSWASVRSPLWVRGVSDACPCGLPSSPSGRHKRPQIHTLHCTKKGTKPMPCPP